MESVCVDILVISTDCFYPVAVLLKLHDKVGLKNFIHYACLYQSTRISNVKVSKSMNDNKLTTRFSHFLTQHGPDRFPAKLLGTTCPVLMTLR